MAVLCLLTNTPWPWPTPAGAASARGGVPDPQNGAVAEWRGRSAAEVCTSAAKRSAEDWGASCARQGRSPSVGSFSLHQRETQRLLWQMFFGAGVAGGTRLRQGPARYEFRIEGFQVEGMTIPVAVLGPISLMRIKI
jgi:hypothetical protein